MSTSPLLLAPAAARARAPRRRWWPIPIAAGALLVAGAAIWAITRLACHGPAATTATAIATPPTAELGDPCGGPGALPCGPGLVCTPGVQKCLPPATPPAAPQGAAQGTAPAAAPGAARCRDGRCCVFSGDPACGGAAPPARKRDFNSYVLRAIDLLYQRYRGLGYDINSAYTHDLDYSRPGEIKAGPRPPATMCVAAVSEVIATAIQLYADEQGDRTVFDKLPARSWMKSTPMDIRPYMFLYSNVDSNGTADALTHFGIGERRPFPALIPGDFIGFNRQSGSGHAVVFLGYLNAGGQLELAYDTRKVVGFKYFSAQGTKPPDAGLGYRWAFFGACPSWQEAGKPRDCGVVPSDSARLLNTGYMLHPSLWATAAATRTLKTALIQERSLQRLSRRLARPAAPADLARLPLAESRQLAEEAARALTVELPATSRLVFNGATTDD